jgi:hypothetical protein
MIRHSQQENSFASNGALSLLAKTELHRQLDQHTFASFRILNVISISWPRSRIA